MLALVESVVAAIERFLALHHAVLERTNLVLTLLVLGLSGLLVLDDLLFSLEQSLFFEGLGLTLSITDQGLSLCVCRLDFFVGLVKTTLLGGAHVGNGGDGTQNDANERCDDRHAHSFLWIRYTTKRTVLTNGSRHLSNMGAAYAGRIQINIQTNSSQMSTYHKANDSVYRTLNHNNCQINGPSTAAKTR